MDGKRLGGGMRLLLLACGPMNVNGAVIFAPPVTAFRPMIGLPEAHPLYLWVISVWILIFGAAYFWMGVTGKPSRMFLAVGAAGKAAFALLLIALAATGELPPRASGVGLPDLGLAAVFAVWLLRTRSGA
jgi:hypothetical protein